MHIPRPIGRKKIIVLLNWKILQGFLELRKN